MSDHTHVQDKHSRDFYNMHLCINPMYQGGCRLSRRVLRLLCAGFEQGEYQTVSTLLVLHITVITQNAIAIKSLIFLGGSPRSGVWRGFRHLRTTGRIPARTKNYAKILYKSIHDANHLTRFATAWHPLLLLLMLHPIFIRHYVFEIHPIIPTFSPYLRFASQIISQRKTICGQIWRSI